jgi:hypothetical protein
VVTAWGVHRGQWTREKLFPKAADLNVSQFLMPSEHSADNQIHIGTAIFFLVVLNASKKAL